MHILMPIILRDLLQLEIQQSYPDCEKSEIAFD